MSSPRINDFAFDDENEDKLAVHGLTTWRTQLLDSEIEIVRNKRQATGSHLVIGRDHGGSQIIVVVEPTRDPLVWRPVTGWLA